MKEQFIKFIEGVSINRLGKTGVVLTTSSFFTFLFLEILRLMGMFTNAYIGLITYLTLPTLFIVGLILIPIGWYKQKKAAKAELVELAKEQFGEEVLKDSKLGAPIFRTVLILTFANVFFLTLASMRGLSFMDEPEFCGTACHSVMNPEWTTYQSSPHAHVKCVECHVGEGVDALVSSKLNGAWQMISLAFDLYERPIPTPVHQLRPARETCEKCHWPDKFYGSKLKSFVHYKNDSASTPLYNTLLLKIDTGDRAGSGGIHWHVSKDIEVTYASENDKRENILWVKAKYKDGSEKIFKNKQEEPSLGESAVRVMDCVDCHNRATHIYDDPGNAIDKKIKTEKISRELPYVKKVAYSALTASFAENEVAHQAIENTVKKFYKRNFPKVLTAKSVDIDNMATELQKTYDRNIFFNMNINWNSYPNHLGHEQSPGCFRCHNENMVSEDGTQIKNDCTLCHSILADESDEPFKFLKPYKTSGKDSLMHKYLQEELINTKIN